MDIYDPGIKYDHMNFNNICLISPEEEEEIQPELSEEDKIQILDRYHKYQKQILISESIEELVLGKTPAITIDIKFKPLHVHQVPISTLTGMFDSGATINCIQAKFARKHFSQHIKDQRGFYVRTASTNIIMSQYIELAVQMKIGEYRTTKFYLLRNSPHRYIISRGLFLALGWTIHSPNGEEYKFTNKSTYENLSPDLYDDIIKHVEYPIKNKTDKQQQVQFQDW